jgi:rubrerythrin
MRTPKNIYGRFFEFEERAAGIYLEFVSRFSRDSELSSFWLDMAMQEKQHAGLLQFCLRDSLFARSLPDSTEIQKLTALFKRLEKQAADPKLTAEQAFRIAIELEASEINTIYSYLTETLHDSIYLLKRKIAITLPDHVDELLAAARKFGIPDRALQELARAKERCSGRWQPHTKNVLKRGVRR